MVEKIGSYFHLPKEMKEMLIEYVNYQRFIGEKCSMSEVIVEALEKWGIREKSKEIHWKKRKIMGNL